MARMNPIDSVRQLKFAGRFSSALRELDGLRIPAEFKVEAQLLKAELLERVGRPGQARVAIETLFKSNELSLSQQGRCEYVLGKAATEDGSIESAIAHLQRAVSAFDRSGYLAGSCAAHIALMLLVSRSGPDAVTPVVAQLRRNATKLGDPITTASLHVFVGEMEVKRGLLDVGFRHANIALGILHRTPNAWLEAAAENVRF